MARRKMIVIGCAAFIAAFVGGRSVETGQDLFDWLTDKFSGPSAAS